MWDDKPILLDRFLGRLPAVPDLDECWGWPQSAKPYRYGDYGRFKRQAHRVMFYIAHGRLPRGGDVRHRCHNGRCVNPLHLDEGTRTDNMQDAVRAGRTTTVVNPDKIGTIRALRSEGLSQQKIADEVGINRTTVSRVLAGRLDHYAA